jgi:DNA-binding NtrC family response regulator
MDRTSLLVVEDRPSVVRVLVAILESGYTVTTTSTVTTAESLIRSRAFDVVLADVRIPDGSGFDVLRVAQAHAPGTRVVMMTAYANVPDAVAAMKLGAFDYIAKPVDADEIALVVARAAAAAANEPAPNRAFPPPHLEPPGSLATVHDLAVGFHCVVDEARDRSSREYLVALMRRFRGNVTEAAPEAQMTRESLHRVLKKYGVQPEDYRKTAAVGADARHGAFRASGG